MELARQDAHLELWDVSASGLDETSRGLQTADFETATVDLGDWEQVRSAAADVVSRNGRVDYLFNNAGIALFATVAAGTLEEYDTVFRSNLWGVIHGTKAFLPYFIDRGQGHIVNVSSLFANSAVPTQSAYSASKGAVSSFTQCLAREMAGTGVLVSLVIPGGLRTGLAGNARIGERAESFEMTARQRITRRLRGSPDRAARNILAGVLRRRRRILTGPDAMILDVLARMFPVWHERIIAAGLGL